MSTEPRDVLAREVGSWAAEITVHIGPGAPSVSHGRLEGRLVAGGAWLVTEYRNPGTGFEGHGVYGWDAVACAFTGTWVDNGTMALRVMHGRWDPDSETMVYEAHIEHPTAMTHRQITRWHGRDARDFSSSVVFPDGKERLVMTAQYRRIGAA